MANNILYLGHLIELSIQQTEHGESSVNLKPHALTLSFPEKTKKISASLISSELRLWIKSRARRKLKRRLDLWSERLSLPYFRFALTDATRQWGSCNSKDTIRLNWRLMMMPFYVIDYVIVHELCHVTHKNHSRAFWHAVGAILPDYKMRQMILKKFTRPVMQSIKSR